MGHPDEPPAVPPGPVAVRWWRRWVWWTAGAAGIVLALVVLMLLLWPATTWWVEHVDGVDLDGRGAPTGTERQDVLDKARGRITAVATGILAAVAIYYTAANARSARQTAHAAQETAKAAQDNVQAALRASEVAEAAQLRTFQLTQEGLRQSEEAQRRTHELTERGQVTDRFTAAVAQLGDTNPAVQLGGVHALAGIADDAPAMRQTCIDVLCAFLRLPYEDDPGELEEDQWTDLNAEEIKDHHQRRTAYLGLREVRHTIIRLIGNHLRLPADDPRSWQGHDFDFTGVVFDGGDLRGAHFTGGVVSFARAIFFGDFTFSGARFSGGQAYFRRATFSGGRVDFRGVTFSGGQVDFGYARFSGGRVSFDAAAFTGSRVSFEGAEFTSGRVDFGYARFVRSRVSFEGAAFTGGRVYLGYARFSGGQVSFEGAAFSSGQADFRSAEFTGGRVDFRYAKFTGSRINFRDAGFSGSRVSFESATFTGGRVDFRAAEFFGGRVSFKSATFTGGQIDLSAARSWEVPPVEIPVDEEGNPPEGVSLPDLG